MRTKNKPRVTRGRGWIGQWRDGTLGWCLPEHLTGHLPAEQTSKMFDTHAGPDERAVLCEIVITEVLDKRGRTIVRRRKKQ